MKKWSLTQRKYNYGKIHIDPYNCKRQTNDPRCPSEELRVRLAIDNPEMVWLDSDIWIRSWPEMPLKGKPYFIQNGNHFGEYAFYVNGCVSFFETILTEYQSLKGIQDNYWLSKLINDHKDDLYVIPQDHFIHCCLSCIHLTQGIWDRIGGKGYEIINVKGTFTLDIKA